MALNRLLRSYDLIFIILANLFTTITAALRTRQVVVHALLYLRRGGCCGKDDLLRADIGRCGYPRQIHFAYIFVGKGEQADIIAFPVFCGFPNYGVVIV